VRDIEPFHFSPMRVRPPRILLPAHLSPYGTAGKLPGRWKGGTGRLSVRSHFPCRVMFSGRMPGLPEVARELLFSVRAPLPDRTQLMGVQVLAAPLMSSTLRAPGPAGARVRFSVFAHERIFPHEPL
jgi:hypothetical protein